jgi:cell division topological specificity factor
MLLKDMIDRLLGRPEKNPRGVARDRLKLVLMQDRSALPAPVMEQIRREILQVLSKYVEIDERELDVSVERADDAVALIANIPIRNVRADAGDRIPQ